MATGWFICRYIRPLIGPYTSDPRGRACAMDRYTAMIRADGGDWRETEVRGNRTLVKVRAAAGTLTTIAADPDIIRIPVALLDDPLLSLSAGQRAVLLDELQGMGYTLGEIQAALGSDLATITLGQLLRFAATRRLAARFDAATQAIVCDGAVLPCDSIDALHRQVID